MNGCAALIARERGVPDAFPDDVRTRWASGRAVQAEDSAERIDELADAAPAADRERPPMMLGSRIEKRLAMGADSVRREVGNDAGTERVALDVGGVEADLGTIDLDEPEPRINLHGSRFHAQDALGVPPA